MNGEILKIGMPAGSLANPTRGGNLIKLLEDAGFKTSGYEAGGPTTFPMLSYFYGWDGRPQEFGSQLALDEIDVAISGDDWIKERILEYKYEFNKDINLERILSLNRGKVRIVAIAKDNKTPEELLQKICTDKKHIVLATEMPFLSLEWLHNKLRKINKYEEFKTYSIQKYKTPPKIEKGIVIYESWGKTESKVKNEGVDFGVEITQSGSALKNYGLNIIDEIFTSETSIWITPDIKNKPQKLELLKMFIINLYGAVNAENKVMLLFNVPNNRVKDVEDYLFNNNLYADEPTKNEGNNYTEFSVQVDVNNPKIPLALVRYELAKMGALSINTLPVLSSIPKVDIFNF